MVPDPGTGAIAYAREHVDGLTREEAAPIIRNLLSALSADKRVKRCDYCGYPFRDDSLRNTRGTCCSKCKTGHKTLQRRKQRADKDLIAGEVKQRKRSMHEEYYVWWLDYPYWTNEYEMLKRTWKHENPYDSSKLTYIDAAQRKV